MVYKLLKRYIHKFNFTFKKLQYKQVGITTSYTFIPGNAKRILLSFVNSVCCFISVGITNLFKMPEMKQQIELTKLNSILLASPGINVSEVVG